MENIDNLDLVIDDILEDIFEEKLQCPHFSNMKNSFFKDTPIDGIFTEKKLADGEVLTLLASTCIFVEKGNLKNSKSNLLYFEEGDFISSVTLQVLGFKEFPIHFLSSGGAKIFQTSEELLLAVSKNDIEMPAGHTAFKKVMKNINGEGAGRSISPEFNNLLKKIKKQL